MVVKSLLSKNLLTFKANFTFLIKAKLTFNVRFLIRASFY